MTPIQHPSRLLLIALLIPLCAIALPAAAKDAQLGVIHFPNSGDHEAQHDFLEGVLFLHNFEYRDAAAAFKRAQEIDPNFAMAFWGEAMTYNRPLWFQQTRQPAIEALRRLGRTPEERRAKAHTPREKDFLHAVETLFGTIEEARTKPKEVRDRLYLEEMRRMHLRYPGDHEAATFYALALLGSAHEGRDFAVYMRAAAVLHQVWDENRQHPGAAHYLIHAYDDPIHAPLGLPMARIYSDIAPSAAHAQHMTSHIFVALGMWDDLVKANERAVDVVNSQREDDERPLTVTGHYHEWLLYGYLQQGRIKQATAMMDASLERMRENPLESDRVSFGTMRAHYVLGTAAWDAADHYAADIKAGARGSRDYYFISAYAAAKRGDNQAALQAIEQLRQARGYRDKPYDPEIFTAIELIITALIDLNQNQPGQAIEKLRAATVIEESLPYEFGPPAIPKPAFELLGEVLLEQGELDDAIAAFNAQLARSPLRVTTLLGLARAAGANGDTRAATEAYKHLADIWHAADSTVPGLAEARQR